ncbi:MAG: pseudouridine synthase [Saprospiraceae bacterium]
MPNPFEVLFEDDELIAINKPTGILVHRTKISEDQVFVLQLLRDQIGQRIYPVHRLDRGTSGVLVFGKSGAAAGALSEQFRDKGVEKNYLAIVRGYVEEQAVIDYPLPHPRSGLPRESLTRYTRLAQTELQTPVGRYETARYSLVDITLETGRTNQIRRHFGHIRHPVIGDKKNGDCKHNKYFETELGISRLLLHAGRFAFSHPVNGERITLTAPIDEAFGKALEVLKLGGIEPRQYNQP